MNTIKKASKLLLPLKLKTALSDLRIRIFDGYSIKSYSQEGEDMILQRIFADKKNGFYVDVGAHHPRRFSNTYYFYKLGWRGINIEPNPEIIHAFNSERKGDINLQLGVSSRNENLKYYYFDEPALNTFDGELVKKRLASTSYKLIGTSDIPVVRLEQILKEYLPEGKTIDFLSIDVEGLDFTVLKSNDWKVFRPKCVLVETLEATLEEIVHGEIFIFMKKEGYNLFAKTYNTMIFCEK